MVPPSVWARLPSVARQAATAGCVRMPSVAAELQSLLSGTSAEKGTSLSHHPWTESGRTLVGPEWVISLFQSAHEDCMEWERQFSRGKEGGVLGRVKLRVQPFLTPRRRNVLDSLHLHGNGNLCVGWELHMVERKLFAMIA